MSPTDIDNELQAGGRSARLSFAELEAGVQAAEDALAAGHYRAALNGYTGLLKARLAGDGTGDFGSADLIVIERLAELATLFGLFTAADNLIEAMVVLSQEVGNGLAADYAHMKRVELALARGHIFESFSLLGGLRDRIGVLALLRQIIDRIGLVPSDLFTA